MSITSCSGPGEPDSENNNNNNNNVISLLSLELSLLKDLLGYSQNLIESALRRESGALAGLLERRGDLIQKIRKVEGDFRALGLSDSPLKSEGRWAFVEWESIDEMLNERQDTIRVLESTDEKLMAILSEWKDDVAAGLILLERGRASALAYSAPARAGVPPVFLDSQK